MGGFRACLTRSRIDTLLLSSQNLLTHNSLAQVLATQRHFTSALTIPQGGRRKATLQVITECLTAKPQHHSVQVRSMKRSLPRALKLQSPLGWNMAAVCYYLHYSHSWRTRPTSASHFAKHHTNSPCHAALAQQPMRSPLGHAASYI